MRNFTESGKTTTEWIGPTLHSCGDAVIRRQRSAYFPWRSTPIYQWKFSQLVVWHQRCHIREYYVTDFRVQYVYIWWCLALYAFKPAKMGLHGLDLRLSRNQSWKSAKRTDSAPSCSWHERLKTARSPEFIYTHSTIHHMHGGFSFPHTTNSSVFIRIRLPWNIAQYSWDEIEPEDQRAVVSSAPTSRYVIIIFRYTTQF